MTEPALALRSVTKRFRGTLAVDDVTLEVAPGSICGLLGQNGAGKTTTFKCASGFVRPDTGSVEILGAPLRPATFERLAYVPEQAAVYCDLRVADHLAIYRRSYRRFDPQRAAEILGRFDLDEKQRAGTLSKGMRTALSLTLAFSIRPDVLLLDEPASGLDPIHQRHVLDLMIDAAANGAAIVFSSHQVTQVERAADRVAILKHGRLVLDRELEQLKTDEKIVEAVFAGPVPDLNGLREDARISRLETVGSVVRATTRDDSDGVAQEIFALRPRSIRTIDLNLEEIFFEAVSGDDR